MRAFGFLFILGESRTLKFKDFNGMPITNFQFTRYWIAGKLVIGMPFRLYIQYIQVSSLIKYFF